MVQLILNFLKGNYKTIAKVLVGLFLLYWVVFVLTPKVGMPADERAKIDSLNQVIKEIYKDQQKLDSNIESYNKKIDVVDDDINKIKGQKTIVKEIYHEEINRAGNYTEPQLDNSTIGDTFRSHT
jgi:septal ring factor EnvC (AmiA/AmiB activator)